MAQALQKGCQQHSVVGSLMRLAYLFSRVAKVNCQCPSCKQLPPSSCVGVCMRIWVLVESLTPLELLLQVLGSLLTWEPLRVHYINLCHNETDYYV